MLSVTVCSIIGRPKIDYPPTLPRDLGDGVSSVYVAQQTINNMGGVRASNGWVLIS